VIGLASKLELNSNAFNVELRLAQASWLLLAGSLSVIAIIKYVLVGSELFTKVNHMGLLMVIVIYLVGGLCGGLIAGILRPLGSTTLGSACVGFLSTIPFFSAVMGVGIPKSDWYPAGVSLCLIFSLIMGGGLGAVFHDQSKKRVDHDAR